jgi:hypothetical protein
MLMDKNNKCINSLQVPMAKIICKAGTKTKAITTFDIRTMTSGTASIRYYLLLDDKLARPAGGKFEVSAF